MTDGRGVPVQVMRFAAGGNIPQTDGFIGAARHQGSTVRREQPTKDAVLMACPLLYASTRDEIPDSDPVGEGAHSWIARLTGTHRGKHTPVNREAGSHTRMVPELKYKLVPGHVPEAKT